MQRYGLFAPAACDWNDSEKWEEVILVKGWSDWNEGLYELDLLAQYRGAARVEKMVGSKL